MIGENQNTSCRYVIMLGQCFSKTSCRISYVSAKAGLRYRYMPEVPQAARERQVAPTLPVIVAQNKQGRGGGGGVGFSWTRDTEYRQ